MLIVSFLVFACISFSAGDSSSYILSEDAVEAEIESYKEAAGLDRPFAERYFRFLFSFVSGDWGKTAGGQDILSVISARIPVTLTVSMLALLLSLLISIPLSYVSLQERTLRSVAATGYAVFVSSSPVFLTAVLLILVFSAKLGFFPVAGYVPFSEGLGRSLSSVFLPSLSLALLHSSLFMIMYRRALRENMRKPYSRTFEALGMRRSAVSIRCASKPAFPLLVMLMGESSAAFLGGSAAVETVFALPGIGSLMVTAALSRDAHLAGILMLLIAMFVSLSSLVAELLSFFIDPRNRRER